MLVRQHILVLIDCSSISSDALRTIRNAAFDYTDVTLLYVYDPRRLTSPETVVFELKQNGLPPCVAQELLDRLRRIRRTELKKFDSVNIEIVVSRDPADAICQLAIKQRVDLVIIATRDRKGISRFPDERVVENIVRRARCGVLVIHRPRQIVETRRPGQLPVISSAIA